MELLILICVFFLCLAGLVYWSKVSAKKWWDEKLYVGDINVLSQIDSFSREQSLIVHLFLSRPNVSLSRLEIVGLLRNMSNLEQRKNIKDVLAELLTAGICQGDGGKRERYMLVDDVAQELSTHKDRFEKHADTINERWYNPNSGIRIRITEAVS